MTRTDYLAKLPEKINTEEELEELLSRPNQPTIKTMKKIEGDLMFLGVGGKMGPTLVRMAKRADEEAGQQRRIIGVSRFSEKHQERKLKDWGIETITCDMLEPGALAQLPEVPNIIFMAGRKFGSTGQEWLTWAMNTYLPGLVAERFNQSRIVAFSTGNVYPLTEVHSGASVESDLPDPVGEYAQSCLGRERMFQYGSHKYNTPVTLIRLNYAVELRYGVLVDIAQKVYDQKPIPLSMGYVNVIWQGDANAQTLQLLEHAQTPPKIINMTGATILSVRDLALRFGEKLGIEPMLEGEEAPTALLSNTSQAIQILGEPWVPLNQVMDWIVHWVKIGGPTLNKPTHYETRNGKF